MQLEKIVAVAYPENIASRRVMEKVGMKYQHNFDYCDRELLYYLRPPAGLPNSTGFSTNSSLQGEAIYPNYGGVNRPIPLDRTVVNPPDREYNREGYNR